MTFRVQHGVVISIVPLAFSVSFCLASIFFPKSISEMLGFSFRSLPRGARFERSLRVTGAGAAEMAW